MFFLREKFIFEMSCAKIASLFVLGLCFTDFDQVMTCCKLNIQKTLSNDDDTMNKSSKNRW